MGVLLWVWHAWLGPHFGPAVVGSQSERAPWCFRSHTHSFPHTHTHTQVGGNFPLYGCCWYVREMLHRPPYLARQHYRSCRAPYRQCMIAAPRCYCLLSHYPFFDLHFRVSEAVVDVEVWGWCGVSATEGLEAS